MYIATVPNRSSPPAVLLRESFRVGKKVRKRTLANLSHLPPATIDALRRALRGEAGADPKTDLLITSSLSHGHVQAVLETIGRIGLDKLIASHRSRERDLIVAMIAARLLFPASKLGTTTRWKDCTLAQELRLTDADEMELYQALDWLLSRQEKIEKRLAEKHLRSGGNVLYDLSSSFYYGTHCPLAKFGHERDRKGLPIIAYGVLASSAGCPVGVQVYEGNTADPRTVADQAHKLKEHFGLEQVVLVGDRGCITHSQIQTLKTYPGLGWIGALKSPAIRKLLDEKVIQPSLFDQQNLAEISSQDFPGERLVACFNPLLADQRREKREELLGATEKELEKIARMAARRTRTPMSEKEIALKVGRVSNKYKVAKHFARTIGQGTFSYCRKDDEIARERQLDGIYVIRTSEPAERLSPADTVRRYKDLGQVERAGLPNRDPSRLGAPFRCLKGMDLMVRPIYLRTEKHVRAHIFLCMLAYYVEWHMRRALAELLYQDEDLEVQRQTRDPVLPAQESASVRQKKATHHNPQGQEVRSWRSLLEALGTLCRNTCRMKGDASESQFVVHTQPNDLQRRAFDLLACTQYGAASN